MHVLYILVVLPAIRSQTYSGTGAVFTAEDRSGTPFLLSNGEPYRNLQTIQASKSVAQFAKIYNTLFKEKAPEPEISQDSRLPKFIQFRNFSFGHHQNDQDIFDFTDSRFLNPPVENKGNRPILKTSHQKATVEEEQYRNKLSKSPVVQFSSYRDANYTDIVQLD